MSLKKKKSGTISEGYFKSSVIVYCFNWGARCGHELREEGKTLVRDEINHRIINAETIKTVEHNHWNQHFLTRTQLVEEKL